MDAPEEPVGELHFMGISRVFGGNAAREIAELSGWAHRGGFVFLDYADDAGNHWTQVVDGDAYKAAVTPFLPVDGVTQVQSVGDWDWKPDQIIALINRWHGDPK